MDWFYFAFHPLIYSLSSKITMKKLFSLFIIVSLFSVYELHAQQKQIVFACNYFGKQVIPQGICPQTLDYASESHAAEVIGKFAKKMGQFHSKFKVMQCSNTDNCFATIIEGQPYIIYDRDFLNRVERTAQTDWAAISILAHEIGHHANFHTIDKEGSRPEKELEADYFSGFWLHQMGATLAQAQQAIIYFQEENVTSTHPPKSQRLLAIKKGWEEADTEKQIEVSREPKNNQPKVQPDAEEPFKSISLIESKPISPIESSLKKTGCITGDCKEGEGLFVHKTQGSYQGMWKNGKRDGYGIQYYPDGTKMFEGEYKAGKREGNGIYYFQHGERFEGKFVNDGTTEEGYYILINNDESDVELTYFFSDGRKEIIQIINE